jgi:antitoxin YefM
MHMKAVTYTNAKKNLKALIHAVCANAEPAIIVSNQSEEQAVLISLEDYQAMEETAYLLSSPANRAHLERSLKQAQNGELVSYPIEDL